MARLCAHRGCTDGHLENTLAAFRAAIDAGVAMIETDLRRAAGGELVLAHDPLGGADLSGLCRLAELVDLARGRVALDVELKEAGYERDVLAALDPRPDGLILTSFLDSAVAALRRLAPAVPAGLLIAPDDDGPVDGPVARALRAGATHLAPHETLLDRRLRDAAVQAGLRLIVWTVNDPGRIATLMADPAVDCVITDRCCG